MTAWPDVIWSAPVLRGLDARARDEIVAAGAIRRMARGDRVYAPGEPADTLYVVVTGAIAVRAVRRGEIEASLIRDACAGDAFGEEATLGAGVARRMEALATEAATVAGIPVHVLRRALERAHAGAIAGRIERTLRRAATVDLLRTMSFARALPEDEIALLVDAIDHQRLARGDVLFREGDAATHAYFVADGTMQLQTEELGRLRVRAYVTAGDFFGDDDALGVGPRTIGAAASGAAWILAVPRDVFGGVSARHAGAFEAARRVRTEQSARQHALVADAKTTQHVFKDLYRLQIARSLLVIDQNACVRCGHCTWSCGEAHADGVSRLVRRGDKIVARTRDGAAPLLVPNSCQHCENPGCMVDCPTGAIGRDPRGEVFIREDLCTGCGNCAKGCPWQNIQIAPRPGGAPVASRARSADVAVKCDLCTGVTGGPACVSSCPTQAIARVDPNEVLGELRALRGDASPPAAIPRARPAWPWIAAAVPIAGWTARLLSPRTVASGVTAGALVLALVAYVVVKRWPKRRAPRAIAPGALRPWFVAHLALGAVACGACFAHAGAHVPPNAAGALQMALLGAVLTGAFGAIAYRVLPARLARIERGGALPEDLAARSRVLDERAFHALSGRSELVKTLFARILRPYARAWLGPLALVARGATLHEEEARLRARIDRPLAGRGADKLEGIDPLIRAVVERRAIPAQRLLQAALRGWLPLHLAFTAVALVLLGVHAVVALVYR